MENTDQKSLYYLEKAPVPKAIMHMVVPMMLSFIASIIYNITDAFFIGKLDNTAMMAAVTLSLAFSAFLMVLGNLFGAGAGTYVSRLLGEGNVEGVKKVSSVNFWSSMFTGVIFMAICLPLLSPLLQLLGARGDITMGLTAILFVFRAQVIGVFSIDAEVIAIGQKILVAQLCSTIFAGLSALFTGIFQAFGKGVQSSVMSVIRGIAFIPILILGNRLFAVDGVIWANTIFEAFACIVGFILFLGIRKNSLRNTQWER